MSGLYNLTSVHNVWQTRNSKEEPGSLSAPAPAGANSEQALRGVDEGPPEVGPLNSPLVPGNIEKIKRKGRLTGLSLFPSLYLSLSPLMLKEGGVAPSAGYLRQEVKCPP